MIRSMNEFSVGGQQEQVMANAKLGKQRVDGSNLHPRAAATIAQLRGCDLVFTFRLRQGQGAEAFDDLDSRLRPSEALEQFLQDQSGGCEHIGPGKRLLQREDFGCRRRRVAPKSKRPNARVDQEGHDLERSRL